MVQDVHVADVVVGGDVLGYAAARVAGNPLEAATQLAKLYRALQEAAEAAQLCSDTCRAMAATACDRAPILCKLLSVGHLFPAEHQELNDSLNGCLLRSIGALKEATDVMYEYMQHGWAGRLRRAKSTQKKMEHTRLFLNERFDAMDSYVGLATYLQVREGVRTMAPLVGAVKALQRDLQKLQEVFTADKARVQALAAA